MEYLDELKYTDKHTYAIPLNVWNGLRKKARSVGREPRLIVDFMRDGKSRLQLVITEGPIGDRDSGGA